MNGWISAFNPKFLDAYIIFDNSKLHTSELLISRHFEYFANMSLEYTDKIFPIVGEFKKANFKCLQLLIHFCDTPTSSDDLVANIEGIMELAEYLHLHMESSAGHKLYYDVAWKYILSKCKTRQDLDKFIIDNPMFGCYIENRKLLTLVIDRFTVFLGPKGIEGPIGPYKHMEYGQYW